MWEGRRRCVSELKQKEQIHHFSPYCSIKSLNGSHGAYPHWWWLCSLFSLLIQILISLETSSQAYPNKVWPAISVSPSPAKLICKIIHHSDIINMVLVGVLRSPNRPSLEISLRFSNLNSVKLYWLLVLASKMLDLIHLSHLPFNMEDAGAVEHDSLLSLSSYLKHIYETVYFPTV